MNDDFDDLTPAGLVVTIYSSPHGNSTECEIANVKSEDARWFEDNDIKVSMEELRTGEFVLYGWKRSTPEDSECIYIVPKEQPCIEAMHTLREICDFAYNENSEWMEWQNDDGI